MNGSGESRWMDDPELPSQILSTPIVPTPDTVTITISRSDARWVAATWVGLVGTRARICDAINGALEGER